MSLHKPLMYTHFEQLCAILFPLLHIKKDNVAISKCLGKDAQGFGKACIYERCNELGQGSSAWQEMTEEGHHKYI